MTESTRLADDEVADDEHGHRPGLRSSRRPRYLKIAEVLRGEIHNGTHAVGRRMPTEDVLCRRFTVSRFTVREALRQLEEHGLIARRRGTSGIVLSTEPRVHYDQKVRSIDELLQYRQAGDFQLLHSDRQHADSTIAGWLNARVGIEYVQLHGIRFQRRTRQPFCLTDVYRRASWQGLPKGHLQMIDAVRALFEEHFEQRIASVEQTLTAIALNAEQARELKVAADTPALRSLRRYFDHKGKLVVVVAAIHPGDLYSYVMRYERSDLSLHV
jgi:DNA-binding GntR family transcriptional regulator